MQLIKSENANINYLSKVINIQEFEKHPNPDCTKLKIAKVDGFSVAVGINEEAGLYIYFPVLSEINPNLLSYLNLYEHSELNKDYNKKGFFGNNGRVKAIKLQKYPSEGFLMPFTDLQNFISDTTFKTLSTCASGIEFDSIKDGDKQFWVSRKFVVKQQQSTNTQKAFNKKQKKLNTFDRLVPDQFKFHYDTVLIRKNPYALQPDDLIHLSSKWHGTSGISAYVLCKHPLSWKEKLAKLLTNNNFYKYEHLYASRSVIKNKNINSKQTNSFYGPGDGREDVDNTLKPVMIKGMTIYYEIVGYTKTGSYWQSGFDYDCVCPISSEYICSIHYKIYVYRITLTNVDGIVHEYSTQEVQTTVKNWNIPGVIPVIQLYYGLAKDLYPELSTTNHWQENFLDRLSNDKNFYMECNSPDCKNKVPHEGIVIKIENTKSEAWKLKCFKFLGKEQEEADSGKTNIEDNA